MYSDFWIPYEKNSLSGFVENEFPYFLKTNPNWVSKIMNKQCYQCCQIAIFSVLAILGNKMSKIPFQNLWLYFIVSSPLWKKSALNGIQQKGSFRISLNDKLDRF